jgi:hypothetical protein
MTEDTSPFALSAEEEAQFAALQDDDTPELEAERDEDGGEEEAERAEDADAPEETLKKPKPTTVPHQALHEERTRRKAAEQAAAQVREQYARDMALINQRLAQMHQPQQAPKAANEDIPDENADPMKAIGWAKQQILEQRQRAEQEEAQRQQYAQQEAVEQQRRAQWEQTYSGAVEEWEAYKAEDPDANDAYQHVLNAKLAEFVDVYGLNPQQAQAELQRFEAESIIYARSRNIPISKLVTGMAKASGFRPKGSDPAAKVAKIADARSRGTSLSSAGGSPAPTAMTAERLLAMKPDEFVRYNAKHPKTVNRLMGG